MPEHLDAQERRELCDLLEELGPDAPTLCEGWSTIDLAAHLVVRERDLRAAPGILLGGRFESTLDRLMEQAKAPGYRQLVDRVRNGPPFGPMAVPGLRTLLNLNEYVVHHEDVRRANGLAPRDDRDDLQDAVWGLVRHQARLMLRKVRGARRCDWSRPAGAVWSWGRDPEAVLTGPPVELVLYLFGRRAGLGGRPERRSSPRGPCSSPRRWGSDEPARGDDAAVAQAGEALPEDGEEHVGGPLQPGVAVVDPVLGAGLEQPDDAAGDEACARGGPPGAGDALDALPPGAPGSRGAAGLRPRP